MRMCATSNIRFAAGYAAVLAWVVENARITPDATVVDLGAGTGNMSALIPYAAKLICVDISTRMMELAKPKLAHLDHVEFVQADLLGYFDGGVVPFDVLVSTYAIHHLTAAEKPYLFQSIWQHLKPGGRAVFGDLMFENGAARDDIVRKYAEAENTEMVETFAEEFFWLVDRATDELCELGFQIVEVRRFSELSWGIDVVKPCR